MPMVEYFVGMSYIQQQQQPLHNYNHHHHKRGKKRNVRDKGMGTPTLFPANQEEQQHPFARLRPLHEERFQALHLLEHIEEVQHHGRDPRMPKRIHLFEDILGNQKWLLYPFASPGDDVHEQQEKQHHSRHFYEDLLAQDEEETATTTRHEQRAKRQGVVNVVASEPEAKRGVINVVEAEPFGGALESSSDLIKKTFFNEEETRKEETKEEKTTPEPKDSQQDQRTGSKEIHANTNNNNDVGQKETGKDTNNTTALFQTNPANATSHGRMGTDRIVHPLVDEQGNPISRNLQNINQIPSRHSCPPTDKNTEIATTLVMQSTLDRLWLLEEICDRWKDPIVVVVFATESDFQAHSVHNSTWRRACTQMNILIHEPAEEEIRIKENYPVNKLRNQGLDAVQTSHILMLDVDLVPSKGLDSVIRETLSNFKSLQETQPHGNAIVVPAWERIIAKPCATLEECKQHWQADREHYIPQDLEALQNCVKERNCSVFQERINRDGHSSTQSASWLKKNWYHFNQASQTEEVKRVPCFDSVRYEPYLVLPWCSPDATTPYYDERFHGYGKNKIQHVSHVRYMGYRFSVLPQGFVVHYPHPESRIKEIWNDRGGNTLHDDMDKLYPTFLKELHQTYFNATLHLVPQCESMKKKKKTT